MHLMLDVGPCGPNIYPLHRCPQPKRLGGVGQVSQKHRNDTIPPGMGPDRSSVRRTDDLSWTCPDLSAFFLRTGHLSGTVRGTCPHFFADRSPVRGTCPLFFTHYGDLSAFLCGQVTCPGPVRGTCPPFLTHYGDLSAFFCGQVTCPALFLRTGAADRCRTGVCPADRSPGMTCFPRTGVFLRTCPTPP